MAKHGDMAIALLGEQFNRFGTDGLGKCKRPVVRMLPQSILQGFPICLGRIVI